MRDKYLKGVFGTCPRVLCDSCGLRVHFLHHSQSPKFNVCVSTVSQSLNVWVSESEFPELRQLDIIRPHPALKYLEMASQGQHTLPMGLAEDLRAAQVKIFCPKCEQAQKRKWRY